MSRLNYPDSAKGICMLLIVVVHVGAVCSIPLLHEVKVSAFFMLSGYFFSVKLPFKDFIIKKYKTILFPFLFFYVISYLLFYAGKYAVPHFDTMTEAKGILDCFVQKQYFNGPLWFLLALFWLQVITYFIIKHIKKTPIAFAVSLLLSCLGFMLGKMGIDLPLVLDTSLSTVFVFHLGYLLRKYSILEKYGKVESGIFSVIFYLSCWSFPTLIMHSTNRYDCGLVSYLYISIVLSIALILFSKAFLDHSGLLAFIGRHSMWIMCVHHLLYRPIKMVAQHFLSGQPALYLTFFITIAICCLTAPCIEKYAPRIIGKAK